MEHKVHPGQHGVLQGVGGLIGGLSIGYLAAAEPTATAEWDTEPSGQSSDDIEYKLWLRGAEGGGSGLHRHRT
jgi:hypothetical protein